MLINIPIALFGSVLLFANVARASTEAWESDWQVAEGFSLDIDTMGYEFPTAIAFVPNPGGGPEDPLYFVTELRGTLKVVTNDRTVHIFAQDFFTLAVPEELPGLKGENGMAGLCLEPEHGYVFVTFAYQDENNVLRNNIVRFETTPGIFSTRPRAKMYFTEIFASHPSAQSHQIGPVVVRDGYLYVSVGDARIAMASRDIHSPVGKILRMTLDGKPVTDNPFYQSDDLKEPANFVWAYGLRNPFSLAFAELRLFAADNGPGVDRLIEVERGRDYLYDGSNWSVGTNAKVVFAPAVSPVQMAYLPADASVFPPPYRSSFYIAFSGFVGQRPGPGWRGEKSVVVVEYDPSANKVVRPPQPFLQYVGRGRQMPVGLAFGRDGLYVVPLFPMCDGESGILRIQYDPEHEHALVIGQDPITLMSANGCFGCHSLDPHEVMPAASLDRESLLSRLTVRLNSAAYLKSLDAVDLLDVEPFESYRQARLDVREASDMERIRTWAKYQLLEPKFDDPGSQMGNLGLSEEEAILITDYLLSRDSPISIAHSAKFLVMRLLPQIRYRHLGLFFVGGLAAGLVGAWAVPRLLKVLRATPAHHAAKS